MKLKDSIILILAVIIAIVVGVFVGIKLTENRDIRPEEDNKTDNVIQDNSNTDNEVDYDSELVNTSLKENLKIKKIDFVDPFENNEFSYDSSKDTNESFTLLNQKLTITKNEKEILLKLENGKQISVKYNKYEDENEEDYINVAIKNNYLFISYSIPFGWNENVKIYNSDLELIFDENPDQMARVLLVGSDIYYGKPDCDGPSEFGDVAVYKFNLNTKKQEFQFYLDHVAGWAC